MKWREVHNVYEDTVVESPGLREAHRKGTPNSVVHYNKYKIGVIK
jgi:hypothetical protein